MAADMDYYRSVRKIDHAYTVGTAVREYLSDNKDVAVRICHDLRVDDMPFGSDELRKRLSEMDPVDVLSLGTHCIRPFVFDGHYQFGGDGNIRSFDDVDFLNWCFSEACNHIEEIVLRKVPIPSEMEEVLDLWIDWDDDVHWRQGVCLILHDHPDDPNHSDVEGGSLHG